MSARHAVTSQHAWPDPTEHPLYYVGIYAAICFASAFFITVANIVQYIGAVRASKTLFRRLLLSVVRATFRFHDTTPAGRLLNRFGKVGLNLGRSQGMLADGLDFIGYRDDRRFYL